MRCLNSRCATSHTHCPTLCVNICTCVLASASVFLLLYQLLRQYLYFCTSSRTHVPSGRLHVSIATFVIAFTHTSLPVGRVQSPACSTLSRPPPPPHPPAPPRKTPPPHPPPLARTSPLPPCVDSRRNCPPPHAGSRDDAERFSGYHGGLVSSIHLSLCS